MPPVDLPPDPTGFLIAMLIALAAAWKAAGVLDARNRLATVAVATVIALVGPTLVGGIVADLFTWYVGNSEGSQTLAAIAPELWDLVSPMAFALMGALGWITWERS